MGIDVTISSTQCHPLVPESVMCADVSLRKISNGRSTLLWPPLHNETVYAR